MNAEHLTTTIGIVAALVIVGAVGLMAFHWSHGFTGLSTQGGATASIVTALYAQCVITG